jgi:endo-1,4-beta-xylanase
VAVRSDKLQIDAEYARAIAQETNLVVAEGETKRKTLQPKPDQYNFTPADSILKFATTNAVQMRGHTFVWHQSNPQWLEQKLAERRDDRLLTDYISTVAGHYKNQFHSWDVVNEVINPDDGQESGLRTDSIWFRAFGDSFIETAFHAAKSADPKATLFLNELNLEADVNWSQRRRRATLKLLEKLIAKNVPVEGLGIQGHLKAYRVKYSDEVFSRFLDEVTSLGLQIMITEFDIADIDGPKDPFQRDADVASLSKRFLDVAFSKKSVKGCVTWGISDKYSWLSQYPNYKWADGQLSRALPFDADFKRKPMWAAMAAAYDTDSH